MIKTTLNQKEFNQREFNEMIGQLDYLISELILECELQNDEINKKTLKHHADDMMVAAIKMLEILKENNSK